MLVLGRCELGWRMGSRRYQTMTAVPGMPIAKQIMAFTHSLLRTAPINSNMHEVRIGQPDQCQARS